MGRVKSQMADPTDELSWGVLSSAVGPRTRLLRNLLRMRAAMVTDPHDLPAGSLTVLSIVSANEGCCQSALADRSGMFTTNVVNIVNELEDRALVRRVRSKQDRRFKTVVLTQEGCDLMETLQNQIAAIEDSIAREFDDGEMVRFIEFLDRAIGALTKGRAKKA